MSAHTPGYEVTPDGMVFSTASNWRGYGRREMRQTPNSDGYPSVRITVDGKRKRLSVHSLVAKQHLPPRPSPAHEVRHLDGNKLNPSVENLAWGTPKENSDDRERHGTTSRGRDHRAAVRGGIPNAFTPRELEQISELDAAGSSQRAIARKLGRSQSGVGAVIRGELHGRF